ncbi:antitoxin VbhA family protein [Glutamicibacter sp. 0426]|uniref:antitoxin VbhA family protein n=1 Tax=Glutamicibacter sp. 0426 TaxID=1913445 RepID=UPI00093E160F|nr:antitoxin VbhA family protein [Glutamicibacter sp. 0426]
MAEKFDIEERWPELFTQLDANQRNAIRQALASAWHEGWVPNREGVENLTDVARGAIDNAEYLRRVREAAHRCLIGVHCGQGLNNRVGFRGVGLSE